ncbi:MAG TPA: glycerate kinase [Chloroflexota bacterium]|nr:glycerate kinase [Chloroflexota bacterium]
MASTPNESDTTRQRHRALALNFAQAALAAVEPASAVRSHFRIAGDILQVDGRQYDLNRFRNVFVVGGGKATAPMAREVERVLGSRIRDGLITVKYGHQLPTERIRVEQAGHPIPDDRAVSATENMLGLVQGAGPDDLVICLLSGGGSALLVAPADAISLADKRRVTNALLRSGATINEINTVRKHLSRIKGGGLARAAYPATIITLILSDVLGDPLDVIASGPTVPDTTTYADAWEVIERHSLVDDLPPAIAEHLRAGRDGKIPESPKPGDPIFEKTQNVIIASNRQAVQAAVDAALLAGYHPLLLSTFIEGEAREVAQVFAAIGREICQSNNPIPRPAVIVAGGETTVTVKGQGRGGRNQEFALAAAIHLEGLDDVTIMGLATDGSDGPTSAAGAIVDGSTVGRALAQGMNPRAFLADNDSNTFFQRLGDLIVTGPTNTNVDDLYVIIVG